MQFVSPYLLEVFRLVLALLMKKEVDLVMFFVFKDLCMSCHCHVLVMRRRLAGCNSWLEGPPVTDNTAWRFLCVCVCVCVFDRRLCASVINTIDYLDLTDSSIPLSVWVCLCGKTGEMPAN